MALAGFDFPGMDCVTWGGWGMSQQQKSARTNGLSPTPGDCDELLRADWEARANSSAVVCYGEHPRLLHKAWQYVCSTDLVILS